MSRLISHEELQKHNTEKSVWMVIHNDVYDVTGFLEEHPGGADSLLEFGGQDGTRAFEDVAHSEDARELMKKFKIGTVPESERTERNPKQTSPYDADNIATGPCGYCPLGPDSEPRSPRPPACNNVPGRFNDIVFSTLFESPNAPQGQRERRPPSRAPSPSPPDPGPDAYTEDMQMPLSSQCIKWALIALAGAVIICFAIKSLRSKSK